MFNLIVVTHCYEDILAGETVIGKERQCDLTNHQI